MPDFSSNVGEGNSALFTDLYELSMMQSYFHKDMNEQAVFSLFVRKLPSTRNFLLSCGLEDVLQYLENLEFTEDDIDFLRSLDKFQDEFLEWLKDFRFTGDVYALPEGTPVFANEPLLEIIAPVREAQLLETYILNQIHFQTLAATKAARVVSAAGGIPVIDFGVRRMHGYDAGIKAPRGFYIAGVQATSNVLAGKIYNIPTAGTMAHSFVQAYSREMDAFRDFARLYPQTILLIDTYDTLEAVEKIIQLSGEMGEEFNIRGVRIDSSNLATLATKVRQRLDSAGLEHINIFASGGLDEYRIADLLEQNAPIDGFGVGTKMGVSDDVPYLDLVYKLTSYASRDSMKRSTGKETLPGQKQIFRQENDGFFSRDILSNFGEEHQGRAMLSKVMENGKRTGAINRDLTSIREDTAAEINKMPAEILDIRSKIREDPVVISEKLRERHENLVREIIN